MGKMSQQKWCQRRGTIPHDRLIGRQILSLLCNPTPPHWHDNESTKNKLELSFHSGTRGGSRTHKIHRLGMACMPIFHHAGNDCISRLVFHCRLCCQDHVYPSNFQGFQLLLFKRHKLAEKEGADPSCPCGLKLSKLAHLPFWHFSNCYNQLVAI